MIEKVLEKLKKRYSNEPEYIQAVKEMFESIKKIEDKFPQYKDDNIYERIAEPERIITFRVVWERDDGKVEVNRGYRVQFNSALGIYKGGLRFHKSVNLSILKFLGFEQTFKNALTTLPLGGAKGGSDFDPKGKSEREIKRFSYAFMQELYRYIGEDTDVPAGDIGVSRREIGYMQGMYKKITNKHIGIITGKSMNHGGSFLRVEATGYGIVYFLLEMLKDNNIDIKNKIFVVSGAGNVALHTIEKLIDFGAKVISFSDSSGCIVDKEGINKEKLEYIKFLKNAKRTKAEKYLSKYKAEFYPASIWDVVREKKIQADFAIPCATQNEINKSHAEYFVTNGFKGVVEGANMPCSFDAMNLIRKHLLFAPSKAANAGGVIVSGFEISQNIMRLNWDKNYIESELHKFMKNIYNTCKETSLKYSKKIDLLEGANIASFLKVADAMLYYG